jgi:hypothetical protein
VLTLVAALQVAAASPAVYNGRAGQTAVVAPRLTDTVSIDGKLDEAVWQRAAVLTGFSVYQPVDNQPAPDSTEVRVWYAPDAIYFGIRAFEPHGPVRATLADRDRISSDDNVEIHLDTFDERNRAFVFIVNPLGVQADGTKSEAGGFIPGSNVAPGQNDLSADFIWQSSGRLTDFGYEVEVRIPFSSLRYPEAKVQNWGLQIDRRAQHNGYEETWTPAVKANASFIAQAGYLRALIGMEHGQVVELNPELTANYAERFDQPAGRWDIDRHKDIGGNLRWTLGSNFVANATMNPDFSQVESDAIQISADPRFAFFYPEKRPFFVEGSEQFNVPNTLVYTRQIVDPDAALKFTGKVGRTDVAVLSARDQNPVELGRIKPLIAIARLRRTLGSQSSVGMLYSTRSSALVTNEVVEADTRILFGRLYYFQAQGAFSTRRDPDGIEPTKVAPMGELVVDRTGRAFGFHYAVLTIGDQFQDDNGFVTRRNFISPSIRNRYTLYGKRGGLFERFNTFGGFVGYIPYADPSRGITEHQLSIQNTVTLRGGWQLGFTPTRTQYRDLRVTGLYVGPSASSPAYVPLSTPPRLTGFMSSFSVATPQFQKYDAAVALATGRDIDFTELTEQKRVTSAITVNLRPTDRLRINGTYSSSVYRRRITGGQSSYSAIPRVKVEYQISRPLFLRLVSQYQSGGRVSAIDDNTGLPIVISVNGSDTTFTPFTSAVSLLASNRLDNQVLLSYRPSPGTVFFVGYGNAFNQSDFSADQRRQRTVGALFIKASYAFRGVVR